MSATTNLAHAIFELAAATQRNLRAADDAHRARIALADAEQETRDLRERLQALIDKQIDLHIDEIKAGASEPDGKEKKA